MSVLQHESLAVIISVTWAKIDEDAAEKAAASRVSSCSSLGISRANRLLHTLVVRMLDRDKVTLLLRTQYASRSARTPYVKAQILIRTSLPRFSSLYNSNII